MKSAAARRRRLALAGVAGVAVAAGIAVGAHNDGGGEPPATASEAPECPAEVVADPARLAGQMVIVRMEAVATDGLLRRIRRGKISGVILFPPAGSTPETVAGQVGSLRAAAAKAGAPAPLVMIDQEGGEVKRLPGLAPDLSPAQIASRGEAVARSQGEATGRELAALGVDVDLAPVLDLPASSDSFIAPRAFGAKPAVVARVGAAFAEGLEAEGVAATAKHFPGLGAAAVNTDLAPSTVGATRAQLEPGLEPFRAAAAAEIDLVMVSNALYPAYDANHPASQSPRVIGSLLRGRLGYEGVVVTDDLGAGALVKAGIGEAQAAVRAAGAGADLLLFALSDGDRARTALTRALRRGELDRDALIDSCARTTALRERLATSAPR